MNSRCLLRAVSLRLSPLLKRELTNNQRGIKDSAQNRECLPKQSASRKAKTKRIAFPDCPSVPLVKLVHPLKSSPVLRIRAHLRTHGMSMYAYGAKEAFYIFFFFFFPTITESVY